MNKSLLGVIIFCIIALVIISPVIILGILSSEFDDFDIIIEKQRNAENETLIGMSYGEVNNEYLKLSNVNYYKPEIITIGASVCMQYKDFFFNTSFYNCGRSGYQFHQYLNFLSKIEDSAIPRIIILDLSQLNFNREQVEKIEPIEKIDYTFLGSLHTIANAIIDNIFEIKNPLLLFSSSSKYRLGAVALATDSGFLKDGSYYYGYNYKNPDLTLKKLQKSTANMTGYGAFTEFSELNQSAIDCLDRFLTACNELNITVVGAIPSLCPSSQSYLESHRNDTTKYIYEIYPKIKDLFDTYGFEVYDFTDMRSFGVDDTYYKDVVHGGEVVYLLMVIDMVEKGSVLGNYTNLDYLKDLYINRVSNLTIYSLDWLNSP